ncbi:hypothetical protein [Ramlibacter sp.]|uniref:hypothetical protein n=1 Tax=Ramlibacter sp. TaxID=1917967 RepID=UPI0035B48695
MSDSSSDEEDKAGKPSDRSGCLPPILFVAAIFVVSFIASQVDKAQPGAGRSLVLWVGVAFAIWVLLHIVWGPTFKETVKNFAGLLKAALSLLLTIMIVGGVAQCVGGGSRGSPEGLGGVPDNWRK